MKKRLISVMASIAILASMACTSAVSTSALSGEITFEIPEEWQGAENTYYAHIWDGINGEGLYEWQTANEKMTVSADYKTATYNIPEGNWNLLMISSGNSGFITYDAVFTADCIGDTCYAVPDRLGGPVDSPPNIYHLFWRNNPEYTTCKRVNSDGYVVGTTLLPGQTNQSLYDDFVKKYNPQNAVDGIVDGVNYFNWNEDGKTVTNMTWEEVTAHLAQKLGVTGETPTEAPTEDATNCEPTQPPSEAPTAEATVAPTEAPTVAPTAAPTSKPTTAPTNATTANKTNTSTSTNTGKGAVNTAQGSAVTAISVALLATAGVVFAVSKKRARK